MGKRKKKHRQSFIIPDPQLPPSNPTRFSFRYLDRSHPLFQLESCSQSFWIEFIITLHGYSLMSYDEFAQDDHGNHRHEIEFAVTAVPNGFSHLNQEELESNVPYQFEVGQHSGWRVIGFLQAGTFYIVWLDSEHNLYAGRGKQ